MLDIKLMIIIIVVVSSTNALPHQRTFSDICGYHNGHRKYLELGESGHLSALNITVPDEGAKQINRTFSRQCTLELVTCPSCIIKLRFDSLAPSSNCDNLKKDIFIILSEPPYDTQANLTYNCGDGFFTSQTRTVKIELLHWNNFSTDALKLVYSVERSRKVITIYDNKLHKESVEVSSPFFPATYPRDFSTEYVLICNIEACRIRLIFSDFQLSRSSSMEFYDTNGQQFFLTGDNFRPPVLISSGSSLTIRFYANGGSDIGYKADVSALMEKDADLRAKTGCGGMVDSVGGAITMMHMMVDQSSKAGELFDCIWIIRPAVGYLMKTHVSLKVETFDKMASKSEIIILQGTTSDRPVLERLESSNLKSVSSRSLVVPITSGFYVRFRGKFNYESRLAIVFTAFSYSKCYEEFLCNNQRCIPFALQCDGFNQCEDNSDEPETCANEWARSNVDRRWHSHTPNYYFPNIGRFPDIRTTTMAFLVSSLSLMFVISCLIITLYRNGNRIRGQEDLQNQLQTISQLLDGTNNTRPEDITEPPPNYEEPPAYDDIIKVGMDEQITKKYQTRRTFKNHRKLRRLDRMSKGLLEVSRIDDSDVASISHMRNVSILNQAQIQNFESSVSMLEATETSTAIKSFETTAQILNQKTVSSNNTKFSENLQQLFMPS